MSIASKFQVLCGGEELKNTNMTSFSVEKDLGQPDMCVVNIENTASDTGAHIYTNKFKPGDPVEIKLTEKNTSVFKGEIVGLEPVYRSGGTNIVVVRAFNRMHRLLRGRKSRTFLKQSDQDIVKKIAGEHGLRPKVGSKPKIKHEHVYQHAQNDLEFLRERAARIGFEVWGDGDDLYFDTPNLAKDSGVKVAYMDADPGSLEFFLTYFAPRLSSAGVVKKVIVRGWNPEKKEEVVGEAASASSKLGSKSAASAASAFGDVITYEVDQPVFSVEEAKAIAEARLSEVSLSYITGEGECKGWDPRVKPGTIMTVKVNTQGTDRFNGKYLVTGVTFKYRGNSGNNNKGGHVTGLRVRRDAEGG